MGWRCWWGRLSSPRICLDAAITLLRRALAGQALLRPHRSHLYQMDGAGGLGGRSPRAAACGLRPVARALALAMLLVPPLWPVVLLVALAGQMLWLAVVLRAMRRAGLSFTASG